MKSFKSYLLPSLIAQIFMSFYVIIDGLFIGYKLTDVGLAAINIAWPITAFFQALGVSMGISGGIYLSRLYGKGEEERGKKCVSTILFYIFIVTVLLGIVVFLIRRPLLCLFQAKGSTLDAAMDYITIILFGCVFQAMGCGLIPLCKNAQKVKIAAFSSIGGTLTNFILDYLLIIVFDFGLKGAAVASVFGQAVAFFICFIPLAKEFKGMILDKEVTKEVFLGAIAPFILSYSYSLLIIVTNVLCEIEGGDACCACYTLLSYLLYVVNALAVGTSDAIQPLFSYYSAKGDAKTNRSYLLKCILLSAIFVLIASFLFFILRNPLAALYNLSDAAKDIFASALGFYLVGFLFVSISKVLCSYFYSVNEKIYANILVLIEPLLLTPICYIIFVSQQHILGIWIGFMVTQILLCLCSILLYFTSRRAHGISNC